MVFNSKSTDTRNSNSDSVVCHYCHESGHIKWYCKKLQNRNQRSQIANFLDISRQHSKKIPQVSEDEFAKFFGHQKSREEFSSVSVFAESGYEAPKLRKLADKVGAAGFYAVVPDFLRGDPRVPNDERPLEVWIKDHGPDQGFEDAKPVLEALKSKGVANIGAVGFCWGAKVVVELAKYAYIQAAVLLHPSFVSVDDMHAVKVPISILGAEIDQRSPPELVKQFELVLNAKPEVDAFVKIFPGVAHGWSVRYKDEDEVAVKSAEEAHQDMLGWFEKHLK